MARSPEKPQASDNVVSVDASSAGPEAAVGREFAALLARRLEPALYLVATPIGHLGDMSLRALAILANADRAYCEDTRTSQKLLSRYAIQRRLFSYHEHNGEKVRPDIVAALCAGQSVALISDAGTPTISDPGFKLSRAVLEAGQKVVPVPGPSAAIAAVSAAGLATDRFLFAGFLSSRSTARRKEIAALSSVCATLVFYESPHRLAAMLRDLAIELGDRPASVARELTKKFEEFQRANLTELAQWAERTPPRGEITIVVGPPAASEPQDVSDGEIESRLGEALKSASSSKAAKQVAEALGVSKSRVYAVGIAMKRKTL